MKVTVSVHGRFHAFELARGLHHRGMLECLQTTYPAFVTRRVLGSDVPLRTAPWLEAWRRLYPKLKLGPQPDLAIARAFGRFAARSIRGSRADLVVGWSSATLEVIAPAHDAGMKVIIERGSTHIVYQTEVLQNEYRQRGKEFTVTDSGIIDRELQEYEMADAISVPSSYAARTFIDRGVAEKKLIVTPLGVDPDRFKPSGVEYANAVPRIVFVGSLGIRKGTHHLLRAFSCLKEKAELHLIGPVEANFASDLADLPLDNVFIRGVASGEALLEHYARADIFCLPSLEEGFGMVALEAMACGLPTVLSNVTGAADVITPGEDGLIVPTGDENSLAEALEELINDIGKRRDMGARARAKVLAGYRWDDYIGRALSAYQRILA
ncbi:MAG: glycosyltransferase family 4 protein [Rhodospirillales bacterium]|nr:glycosyltransferase family 4 protein [Rhodospirillales bacterium]